MKRNLWVLSVLISTRQSLIPLAMWTKKPNPFPNHPQMQRHMCLVGHYVSPAFLLFRLVAVVATPATATRVSVVGTEATSAVVTVAGALVGLVGSALVTESAESTILGVQLGVATKGLLALLALERGETSLCLGLSGNTVGSGSGAVLGEGGARAACLRGLKALGLIGSNRRLSSNRRVLAEATLGAAEYVRHSPSPPTLW